MHIADIPGGNLGATGVVGGGIPTSVGIALALQMRRSTQILLSYFGDGATNEGEFHASLNMASTWKLPVVFICDNNQYGMSMHVSKVMNTALAGLEPGHARHAIRIVAIDHGEDCLRDRYGKLRVVSRKQIHEFAETRPRRLVPVESTRLLDDESSGNQLGKRTRDDQWAAA